VTMLIPNLRDSASTAPAAGQRDHAARTDPGRELLQRDAAGTGSPNTNTQNTTKRASVATAAIIV
jgi:hypothetical protein